ESPALYQPPESPHAPWTAAGDVYSLGCLLFRLATGNFPFEGADADAIGKAHAPQMPDPITRAIAQGASGDPLMRVVGFAMAKHPAARFQDASLFARALDALAPHATASVPATAPPTGQAPKAVVAAATAVTSRTP